MRVWRRVVTDVGIELQLAILLVAAACAFLMKKLNDRENARREALDVEEIRAKYSDAELQALGDRSPFYRYVT